MIEILTAFEEEKDGVTELSSQLAIQVSRQANYSSDTIVLIPTCYIFDNNTKQLRRPFGSPKGLSNI